MRADDTLLGSEALTLLRRRLVVGHDCVEAPVLVGDRVERQGVAFRRHLLEGVSFAPEAEPEALMEAARRRAQAPVALEVLVSARGQRACSPRPSFKQEAPARERASASTLLPAGELVRRMRQHRPSRYLLFIRHAEKAPGPRFEPLDSNRHRALSRPGEDECVHFARALSVPPELIVCSALERARQTAHRLQGAMREQPELRCLKPLAGGQFEDHARWLELKGELGWEELVRRWIEGRLPSGIVTPYAVAVEAIRSALGSLVKERGVSRVLVVTQGYVNTALFHAIHGRIDFTGGPLFGFLSEHPARFLERA
jgi:broad specificity phosphatase PhoE